MVLHVGLEMIGQIVDARGKQRDLHFRRAGVGLGPLMFLQNLSLLARCYRHYLSPKERPTFYPRSPGFPSDSRGLIARLPADSCTAVGFANMRFGTTMPPRPNFAHAQKNSGRTVQPDETRWHYRNCNPHFEAGADAFGFRAIKKQCRICAYQQIDGEHTVGCNHGSSRLFKILEPGCVRLHPDQQSGSAAMPSGIPHSPAPCPYPQPVPGCTFPCCRLP